MSGRGEADASRVAPTADEGLRDLVARYLAGGCSPDEREALERALVRDDVARVFGEELLLRDALRHAPADDPAPELVARWESAVLDAVAEDTRPRTRWWSAASEALGWAAPARAVPGNAGLTGFSALRFGFIRVRR